MAEFSFELVSPERVLMSESVEHVVLPGSEGLLGVLSGHSPAVVTLKPGVISVLSGSTVTRKIYVRGGFAEINPETVTVLAEHALDTEAADRDAIASEIEVAEKDLSDATTDDARFIAQSAVDALRSL
ncbi:MAG: F0F1 ATP synthase subunit epsilon [Pseudomonadota bacterium]